jgi:hypothetical protein
VRTAIPPSPGVGHIAFSDLFAGERAVTPTAVHERLLRRAAEILGGEAKLRAFLGAPERELRRWLNGEAELPSRQFLKLVDLVMEAQDRVNDASRKYEAARARAHARLLAFQAQRREVERLHEKSRQTLADTRRLLAASLATRHSLGARDRGRDPLAGLGSALDDALSASGGRLGLVHLMDQAGALRIAAQRGLPDSFAQDFAVDASLESPFGYAAVLGEQVVVPDVAAELGGSPQGDALSSAGCAALVVTPMLWEGETLGVLSAGLPAEREAPLAPLAGIAQRTARQLGLVRL